MNHTRQTGGGDRGATSGQQSGDEGDVPLSAKGGQCDTRSQSIDTVFQSAIGNGSDDTTRSANGSESDEFKSANQSDDTLSQAQNVVNTGRSNSLSSLETDGVVGSDLVRDENGPNMHAANIPSTDGPKTPALQPQGLVKLIQAETGGGVNNAALAPKQYTFAVEVVDKKDGRGKFHEYVIDVSLAGGPPQSFCARHKKLRPIIITFVKIVKHMKDFKGKSAIITNCQSFNKQHFFKLTAKETRLDALQNMFRSVQANQQAATALIELMSQLINHQNNFKSKISS